MDICKKVLVILFVFVCIAHGFKLNAQSVQAEPATSCVMYGGVNAESSQLINLGADVDKLDGIHGITYKFHFDPKVIYRDSIFIIANSKLLGLKKNQYLEMQRVDSSYVLYSLTVKGRKQILNLDKLPINLDFVIKPETYYQLITNNCEYTIEFEVESLTAYDREKTKVELTPFVLPIDLKCESDGELQYLLAAPNPTRERCWVYIPADKMKDIRTIHLFDVKGERLTVDCKKMDDQLEVNLSDLRPGHYYLNIIYSGNKKDVVKLVKL